MRKAKTGVIRATVLSRVASYEEEGDDYSGLAKARPTSRQIAVAWAEWVLDGTDRENLDRLRVGWISGGSYETAWVTPGHDYLCPYQYGRGAAVRPQTNDAIWDGVIGLWCRVVTVVCKGECANGSEPEPAAITNPCSGHRISLSS